MGAHAAHAAPGSQIKSARAPEGRQTFWPVSVGLPGLSFFSRTFQGATRFALAPGYHLPRLRRSNDQDTHVPDNDHVPDQDSYSRPGLMTGRRCSKGSEAPQAR
jgi:hypothetical protein